MLNFDFRGSKMDSTSLCRRDRQGSRDAVHVAETHPKTGETVTVQAVPAYVLNHKM